MIFFGILRVLSEYYHLTSVLIDNQNVSIFSNSFKKYKRKHQKISIIIRQTNTE